MMKAEELKLTQAWDKVFPKSSKVDHKKVTFVNHFGITLAADMYIPKNAEGRLPGIAVSGPFGACKEQSSGLYASLLPCMICPVSQGTATLMLPTTRKHVIRHGSP